MPVWAMATAQVVSTPPAASSCVVGEERVVPESVYTGKPCVRDPVGHDDPPRFSSAARTASVEFGRGR